MIKLKPCPFCGSEMIAIYEIGIYHWEAECCCCHSSGMWATSADKAARAWNMRKGEKENEKRREKNED